MKDAVAVNLEYSSRNPETKFHGQRIGNLAPGIRNPRLGIQNPILYWIPLQGAIFIN